MNTIPDCNSGLEEEKKYGLPVENILAGEINFSLPFLFIELPKWRCLI
jgi:hypothetical protein